MIPYFFLGEQFQISKDLSINIVNGDWNREENGEFWMFTKIVHTQNDNNNEIVSSNNVNPREAESIEMSMENVDVNQNEDVYTLSQEEMDQLNIVGEKTGNSIRCKICSYLVADLSNLFCHMIQLHEPDWRTYTTPETIEEASSSSGT